MSTSNCYRGSNKNNSPSRTNKNTPESFDSELTANQKCVPNIPQYPSNKVTNDQRSLTIHPATVTSATVTSATAKSSNNSNTNNGNNSISISNRNHNRNLNYQEENRYTTQPYPSTSSNAGMHSNRKYPIPDPAFRPPSSSLYYSYNHTDPRNYTGAMTSTSSYSDPRSYWYQQYHQQPQHQHQPQPQPQQPYHQHQLHHHSHYQQPPQQHHPHHQLYQQQQQQQQQHHQLQQQSQLHQQQQQTQHHHLTPSGGIQPYHGNNHHDHVVDMLHLSNSGREARNRAEKNRRDKLNGSIQELSSMVPHVAESPRRVDKTAVLRFSAHGLRLHYVFGKTLKKSSQQNAKPQLTDSLMKLMDSFLITITCHGQIVLISPSVEQHLGHCQTDLFGQNILHITHPDDHAMLKQQLIPTDLENLLDIQPEDDDGEPRTRSQSEEDEIDRKLRTDKRNFTVRLARAGPRSEPTCYEIVKIDGCFRRSDSSPRGAKTSTFPSGLQLIRRARGRDDTIPLHSISGNDIVLVAMARIIRPPKLSSRLLEANYFEYKTRHLIDGRIVDCDQRISLVAGYMTDEVTGLSPFTFIHQDDVRWVIVALRQMYDSSSPYGESCYRLLTRNGRFIYLRTKGYLEIDKATNKVHSFVCINSLCNEVDGKVRCDEMKNKFSIIIDAKVPSSSDDVPASENPQQLEKAVMCLIQNLHNNAADEDTDDTASSSQTSPRSVFETRHRTRMTSQSRTPPLALIVPETSTVKSSISKSVSAVNVTVVKSLRNHSTTSCSSPSSRSHDADISNDSINSEITTTSQTKQDRQVQQQKQQETQQLQQQLHREQQQIRPSVLQKNGNLIDGSMPQSISLLRSSPEIVEIKQEYTERVPSLANNDCNCDCDCDCYFDNDLAHNDNCILYNPTSNLLNEMLEPIGHTSVLKRRHDYQSDSNDSIDDNETNHNAKRRIVYFESFTASQQITDPTRDLHNALTSTFDELGRSLNEIENVTSELREQCNTYIVPKSQLQLEEIIEEQQEQRDMLVNIKSEYEAQLQQNGTGNVMADNDIEKMSIENPVDIKLTHKNDLMPR